MAGAAVCGDADEHADGAVRTTDDDYDDCGAADGDDESDEGDADD